MHKNFRQWISRARRLIFGTPKIKKLDDTPRSDEAKAGERDIYAAVGRGISLWFTLEAKLCFVLCRMIMKDRVSPVDRMFWSQTSFEAKIKMVNEVADQQLRHHPNLKSEWDKIYSSLRKTNKKRNRLAHSAIVFINDTPFLAPFFNEVMVNISKRVDESGSFHFKSGELLQVKEIQDIHQGILQGINRLQKLYESIDEEFSENRKSVSEK